MVKIFTAVLNMYDITNFNSHVFFAFSHSFCKTMVIFKYFIFILFYFFSCPVCVCVCVCVSVRSFLPPRASKLRNIGMYVFTTSRENFYNRDFR